MTDYERSILRGAALMDAYAELAGEQATVEDLLVDLVAYRQAGR